VAVLTGQKGGIVVLDEDVPQGEESRVKLQEYLGVDLTSVVVETTPSGGRHFFFRYPEGHTIRRRTPIDPRFPKLDLIADNSYVIVSPSIGENGSYRWEEGASPFDHKIPPFPEPLLEFLLTGRNSQPSGKPSVANAIPEGARNSRLTSIAGAMHRQGSSPAVILSTLRTENQARCVPPLPDSEVTTITRSVTRYPQEAGQCETCTHEVLWRPPEGPTATLDDVLAAAGDYLPAQDLLPVRACCAAYTSKLHPGVSVNLVIAGGQTPDQVVSSLKGLPLVKPVDRATPSSLLSSLPRSHLPLGAPAGLLEEVGSSSVIVVRELLSLLKQPGRRQSDLLSVLNSVLSGSLTLQPGAGGVSRVWTGDISMISGISSEIDDQRAFMEILGPRFVIVRCRMNPFDLLRTASSSLDSVGRERLKETFHGSVKGLAAGLSVHETLPVIAGAESRIIRKAGIITAISRSPVIRDSDGNPLAAGSLEDPTQFIDMLSSLFHGCKIMGMSVDEAVADIVKIAFQSISPWLRARLLMTLHGNAGASSGQMSLLLSRARTTVRRELEALRLLGMARSDGSNDSWSLSDEAKALLEDTIPLLRGDDL